MTQPTIPCLGCGEPIPAPIAPRFSYKTPAFFCAACSADPPLVKGGQGRGASEVRQSANIVGWCIVLAIVALVVLKALQVRS